MKSSCAEYRSLMPEYIAGCLPAHSESHLEAHLFACEECHVELTSLKDFSDLLHTLDYGSAPEELSLDRVRALKSEHEGMLRVAGLATNVVPFAQPAKQGRFRQAVGAWPMWVAAASFLIVGLLSVPYANLNLWSDTVDSIAKTPESPPSVYSEAIESLPYLVYRPTPHPRDADIRMANYSRDGLIFPPENSARMEQHLSQSARYGVIFPRGPKNG